VCHFLDATRTKFFQEIACFLFLKFGIASFNYHDESVVGKLGKQFGIKEWMIPTGKHDENQKPEQRRKSSEQDSQLKRDRTTVG
jgi:hypothetical protein